MIDRAIKGSPLTKKEKEKIEILLEGYELLSSSENWNEFWNKFLLYVEKKKKRVIIQGLFNYR